MFHPGKPVLEIDCSAGQGGEAIPFETAVAISGRTETGAPVLEMLERGSSANLTAIALADGIALLPPEADEITDSMPLGYEPFWT